MGTPREGTLTPEASCALEKVTDAKKDHENGEAMAFVGIRSVGVRQVLKCLEPAFYFIPAGSEFFGHFCFPRAFFVKADIDNSTYIVGCFDITSDQRANVLATKLGHQVAVLKNDILSRALLGMNLGFMSAAPYVTGRV